MDNTIKTLMNLLIFHPEMWSIGIKEDSGQEFFCQVDQETFNKIEVGQQYTCQ